MNVFVAGATGAIGRPLVTALIASGHHVIGTTTSSRGATSLRALGADAVVLDVLDAETTTEVICKARPDVIINELTSLPARYTHEELRIAAPRDRRVRLDGGRNLQHSALKAGVKRYIVQSSGFYYGPGEGLASERDDLADDASPGIAATVRTYREIERQLFAHPSIEGVALRYGFFYGPRTYYDAESGSRTQQVRDGQYPLVEPGSGAFSFIHVEDAASATVEALECPPGVYNIVDDDPSPLAVWLPAFAQSVGAPSPVRVSVQEALGRSGPDAVYYALHLRGASNAKAKGQFKFTPRPLEWLKKPQVRKGD